MLRSLAGHSEIGLGAGGVGHSKDMTRTRALGRKLPTMSVNAYRSTARQRLRDARWPRHELLVGRAVLASYRPSPRTPPDYRRIRAFPASAGRQNRVYGSATTRIRR